MGFNWLDYLVLIAYLAGLMLVATKFLHEQHNSKEFFVAGNSIPWWGAGLSIIATLVSTISLLGGPADFFRYGFEGFGLWWVVNFLAAPVIIFVFIRFFLSLGIVSAYEYLELRFSLAIRMIGSGYFLLMRALYIGVVLYSSAIAFEPFTGIPVVWLMVIVGVCSALYAVTGGIKAVIWTDVIQFFMICLGLVFLVIIVLNRIEGGFSGMCRIAAEHGHDFSYLKSAEYWRSSPFVPNAFLWCFFGMFFNAMAQKGTDQMTVQRYLSTRNARESAKALLVEVIGNIPFGLLTLPVALGIFAWYHTTGGLEHLAANNYSGLLPEFVAREFPHGLAGLFAAALMAAVISTVDSGLNCLATVTMTDFQQRFRKTPLSDAESVRFARFWTVVWAVLCIGLAFFIYLSAYDNIARVSSQVIGLFSGAILGIFLLGMLVPRTNAPGVGIGAIAGGAVAVWANYFWTETLPNGALRHVCVYLPITFGVLTTLLIGLGASFCFAPPRREQLDGLNMLHLKQMKTEVPR